MPATNPDFEAIARAARVGSSDSTQHKINVYHTSVSIGTENPIMNLYCVASSSGDSAPMTSERGNEINIDSSQSLGEISACIEHVAEKVSEWLDGPSSQSSSEWRRISWPQPGSFDSIGYEGHCNSIPFHVRGFTSNGEEEDATHFIISINHRRGYSR
jgi:hypothetical protein